MRTWIAMTAGVAIVSIAGAAPYPSSWTGEFDVEQVIPDISVPGVSILATYGGKVPIAVSSSGITGTGTLPYHMQTDNADCTLTSHGNFKMTVTGKAGAADAGSKGSQLKLKVKRVSNDIGGKSVCRHPPSTNTIAPKSITDGGPLNVPLADKEGPNGTWNFGGTVVKFKMQLKTPCKSWDSRKDPGPKVNLDPDPSTFTIATPVPDHTQTIDQLTARHQSALSNDQVLVENLIGAKALGLTIVPFDFPTKIKTATSKPQIAVYKECDAVDSVSIDIPILSITSYVASDLPVNGDCERLVEEHEIHHVMDARREMHDIASEIDAALGKRIHGPYNEFPSVTKGWDKMEEQSAQKIIDDIINFHKLLWKKERDTLDAHDKAPIKAACKQFLPSPH